MREEATQDMEQKSRRNFWPPLYRRALLLVLPARILLALSADRRRSETPMSWLLPPLPPLPPLPSLPSTAACEQAHARTIHPMVKLASHQRHSGRPRSHWLRSAPHCGSAA
jgi:hypothetical protein